MKKLLFPLLFILTASGYSQEVKDTSANIIVISEEVMECVNDISDNPDAIKYLLQGLAADKEKFRELFRIVVNDPAMKEVIRELRNTMREDRGSLEESKKKRNVDMNKNDAELTFNSFNE